MAENLRDQRGVLDTSDDSQSSAARANGTSARLLAFCVNCHAAVSAPDLGQPLTLIGEAVFARCLSALKDERVEAAKVLAGPGVAFKGDRAALIADLEQALYASRIVSYAQGDQLMRAAAAEVWLEAQQWWHRADLARRLHHPLGFPGQDQGSLRCRSRPCQPAARPVLPGCGRSRPGRLAPGGDEGRGARHSDAGHRRGGSTSASSHVV